MDIEDLRMECLRLATGGAMVPRVDHIDLAKKYYDFVRGLKPADKAQKPKKR